MLPSKPSIDIIRIDKRLLTNDLSIKSKRIKIEPTYPLTDTSPFNELSCNVKRLPLTVPPSQVSYLPDGRIPTPPQPPKTVPKNLSPATPSIIIETSDEATSSQLQQYCLVQPISVVRGLTNALQLDLGLYSTRTLVETQPDHQIEVRTQRQQASDENIDFTSLNTSVRNIWKCESSRSYTTIAKYAQYQALTYDEMIEEQANETSCTSTKSSTCSNINGTSKKCNSKITRKLTID
jgi:lysine-specific demethylase 6A